MGKPARVQQDEPRLWQEFKRQSIQAAVIRLMCREGLESVTMERVAQETGIAKGTVYLHYRDKQELLDAVKESSLDPLTEKLAPVFASSFDAERKLETFALRYLSYFDENRDLFRILLYDRAIPRSSRYKHDRYRQLLDGVTGIIDEGIAAGSFRDVTSRKAAAMFLDSAVALVSQRLLSDDTEPVEDDAALIAELFVRGLAADSKSKHRKRG